MAFTYRLATLDDIPALEEIRNNVTENALVNTVITREDYARAMTEEGRAWLCEADGEDGREIVGFTCGRHVQGDIWALFVRQSHESRGIGNALMDLVEPWMHEAGVDPIWLVTAPGTRAERLYERRGWTRRGVKGTGEVEFVLPRPER